MKRELTFREVKELREAQNIVVDVSARISEILFDGNVDTEKLWELRNHSAEISAVLYNVHHDIYQPEARS